MKHIDPLMRAQLIKDYTEKHRRSETVGKAPIKATDKTSDKMIPIEEAIEKWKDEIPEKYFQGKSASSDFILFYILSELGYKDRDIIKAVYVYVNMVTAKLFGKSIMESNIDLSEASVLLNCITGK